MIAALDSFCFGRVNFETLKYLAHFINWNREEEINEYNRQRIEIKVERFTVGFLCQFFCKEG